MITRKQYIAGEYSHRDYYGQFVTSAMANRVAATIGNDRLRASEDEHLNDIPLAEWDLIPIGSSVAAALKECGDYLTKAGAVCLNKEAARQWLDKVKG